MMWMKRYAPPSRSNWQGRADSPESSCFFQIIKMLDLQQTPPVENTTKNFALIGFCCEEGIRRNLGRLGAASGPQALREVFAKFPCHRKDIICYDAGDITCTDNNLEEAQQALGEAVALLLSQNITPIVIGGGHELAWGHFQGIAKKFPHENLGIINFDAHFDMRPLLANNEGSSGTPFLQIANAHEITKRRFDYNCIGIQQAGNTSQLFAAAKNHHVKFIYADDLQTDERVLTKLTDQILADNQIIYVSLCLDVFASAYAPGVSAPQALGLTPWQLIPALRSLASSGKVVSYDIAELSPPFDLDSRTTKLAANLLYQIIHHHNT